MSQDTICCAGARLTGTTLSGRGDGGAVWTVDLAQVTQVIYAETRGLARLRHALLLRDPDGWRQIEVMMPRRRMAQSRDLMEHRALCAAVAERLAELRPGFRIEYRVSGVPGRVPGAMMQGGLVLVAVALVASMVGGAPLGVVTPALLVVSGALLWRGLHRRCPAISASALPGILTAAARRQ